MKTKFLERASSVCQIVDLPIGRVGLYACMDGVINETPRGLALRGAQILCNSLNSFARDEANLHIPVRAPENHVFIVAANKVDPLIPAELVEPVSQQTNIPPEFLDGAGESQIVAPDGTVLAKGPLTGEAVVVYEIDPSQADDKTRPDGTDIFANRRPELYGMIANEPAERNYQKGAEQVSVAVYQPESDGVDAIEEAADGVSKAVGQGAKLVVLPELFCIEDGIVTDPASAADRGQQAIAALSAALNAADVSDAFVVTSIVEAVGDGYAHTGVLIRREGVVAMQRQLHAVARHGWVSVLGNEMTVTQLDWARFAMVVGDDSIYPETFRLASLQDAEVVGLPMHVMEAWELGTGLQERSAENRMCLVSASRPTEHGAGAIMTLHSDFTIMTPWETRPFDGNISAPVVSWAENATGLTVADIHPVNAENRFVSHRTDVVDGRPWHLVQAITGTA